MLSSLLLNTLLLKNDRRIPEKGEIVDVHQLQGNCHPCFSISVMDRFDRVFGILKQSYRFQTLSLF